MTRDEAMQLAEQAGIEKWWNQANADQRSYEDALVRLVTMAAKTEREACAKVCEEIEDEYRERESLRYAELRTDAQTGASDCAYRIRARGDA